MRQFQKIASRLKVPVQKMVPGEHDAGLDGGALYRQFFGNSSYSFDHRGVHFVALDNVSRPKPEVGAEGIDWLRKDLARYSATTPIIVFTHRPLFDLKPEWEWFTRDGDEVMKVLSPYENVTVLYGHIHREHVHDVPHCRHVAARSLIFAFPDPEKTAEKKPLPFDAEHPSAILARESSTLPPAPRPPRSPSAWKRSSCTMREHSGTEGFQQLLRPTSLKIRREIHP